MPRKRHKGGSFKALRLPKALRFYTSPTNSETNFSVRSFLTLRRDERVSLPGRGLAGFVPAGSEATGAATGAPPAGGDTGWRAGGARVGAGGAGVHQPQPGLSRPGGCPPPGCPEATVSALWLWRGAGAPVPRARPKGGTRLFWVVSWLAREGRCRLPPPRRAPAPGACPRDLRRVPGGARRSAAPALGRGRCAGPGAAPPGQQSEGCRAKTVCSPHLGALFDLMCCLGRAVTEVVLLSEIGGFVRCSPHTFLTTVITKLIAGPKTDVKTS